MTSGKGNESQGFVPAWHFVDASGKESRRQSRLHAMRETSRKHKWLQEKARSITGDAKPKISEIANDAPFNRSTGDESDEPSDTRNKAKPALRTWRRYKLKAPSKNGTPSSDKSSQSQSDSDLSPSPKSILAAGQVDPFGAYPIPNTNHHLDSLAAFYLAALGSTLLGVPADAKFHPARDFFLIPSMKDSASFHALMAYVGFIRDEMYGRATGPEALSHKLEAITMVNDRLRCGRIDDSTIEAINLLWTQEARLDNEESTRAHLDGLQHLIHLRGGLAALAPSLQLALSWSIATVPGRFTRLLSKSSDSQTQTPEIALLTLLRSVQTLLQHPNSPYPLHSPFFSPGTPLHKLLSRIPDPDAHFVIRLTSRARMKATCRLAALLNLHSIYLNYFTSARDLSQQLLNISSWMLEHQMHRRGTVELFSSMMMVREGEGNTMNDRAWRVVRIMSVAKSLSLGVLNDAGDLLFGCLTAGAGSANVTEVEDGESMQTTEAMSSKLEFVLERIENELCGILNLISLEGAIMEV